MSELLLEAAKELQARTSFDRLIFDFHRTEFTKAAEQAATYGGPVERWRESSRASFIEASGKHARASSLARRLMGIE